MKLHTMSAAAAVLIGLTGVALAQQDIFVEKGMMVDGGDDFSYAGTWGNTGYIRDRSTEAPAQSAPAPAPVTRTITPAPVPVTGHSQAAPTSAQTRTVSPAPATNIRYPATRSAAVQSPAPAPAPAPSSALHVTAKPVPAWPVTRAPTHRAVSQTSSAAAVKRQATVTQPVQQIVSPAPAPGTAIPARPSAPTQTRYPATRAPQAVMRRVSARAPANPVNDPVPNGDVGDCFARVMIPATYNNVPDQITVQDSYEGLKVREAVFADDVKRVKVRDETVRYVVRQPKYRVEMERVVVKPAYERLHVQPAQWNYVDDIVKISEPRLVWKAGTGLSGISRVDPKTGVTYCLVEEEGETKRVRRRVMASPERVSATMVPEQVITVAHQILIDKGGVTEVAVPAEYREIPIRRLVSKARTDKRQISEKTQNITKRTLATPERFEWVPVLCETNATPGALVSLQRELKNRGFYHGPLDGVFGQQSVAALAAFQKANNIKYAGFITLDTLRGLNLSHLSGHQAIHKDEALKPRTTSQLRGFQSALLAAGQSSASSTAQAGAALARELAGGPQAAPIGAAPAGPVQTNNRRRNTIVPAMDVGPENGGLGEVEIVIAPASGDRSAQIESQIDRQTETARREAPPYMRRRLTWAGRTK